jgi:hypothetical protein
VTRRQKRKDKTNKRKRNDKELNEEMLTGPPARLRLSSGDRLLFIAPWGGHGY